MDGSTVIMLAMPETAAQSYLEWIRKSGSYAMIGLLIAWQLFDKVFQPVFFFALHILYSGTHNG
jgi:hypothetical protein